MEMWYIRNTAGKVFGPAGLDALKDWARDGRIEPLAGVSQDLENWVLAPLVPDLEMDCVVENNPGQFYGPTHRAVAENLLASGELAAGAHLYRDARALDAERMALIDALAARDERLAATAAERDAARAEVAALQANVAALEADIASLKAELAKRAEVHAREWKAEVLEPEVITNEPPPPVARAAFAPARPAFAADRAASLAELERRAQQELARMGPDGARKFFSRGRK